jgi:hypothetical protein
MSRRLPDWAYARLERVYFSQRTIRRRESRSRLEAEDRSLRAWADAAREAHRLGECVPRCPFAHGAR